MVAVVQKDNRNALIDNRYRLGMLVLIAPIIMLFTALTSAYIVRAASSTDWQLLPMPRILIGSTLLILISSGTFEKARRALRSSRREEYFRWILLTGTLGTAFLVTQILAFRQLVRQGVHMATHPHGSFFYLLAAAHGIHLIGGLLAVTYLIARSRRTEDVVTEAKTQAVTDAATLYWHFMDGLWIYLFVLLFFWR